MSPLPRILACLGALVCGALAFAQLPAPAFLAPTPTDSSGVVGLAWTEVPGATGYSVRRSTSLGGATTTIAASLPAGTTTIVDAAALAGVRYLYTVVPLDASGPSPATRSAWAAAVVLLDNAAPGNAGAGVSFTGTWQTSALAGSLGAASLYAPPVAGSVPTATYTFTPTLPARGLYDVYLRWTADPNRASNTPVEVVFPDGQRSLVVNQRVNGGVWNYLTTVCAETGTTTSLSVANTGADGNVVVDAVEFVPRHAPWAPAGDAPELYTLLPLDEPFDGASLNGAVWGTFAGRSAYSVSDGRLRTRLVYTGAEPIVSATTADLENEANWNQGGIISDHAHKFGYHEARLRLPAEQARGVDTAYWHAATDELIHGYEIDAPEFFNKDSSGALNNFGFGNWDHVLPTVQRINPDTGKLLSPGRTWDYTRKTAATFGDVTQYVTIGFEWRTDNTQIVYLNGQKAWTTTPSGMNDIESILPANIILSTKVLGWLRPNTALNGAEATWDYVRFYEKPGFVGAVDGTWSNAANWGPDGLPGPGYAAVFNLASAPAIVTLPGDQSLQSLFVSGSVVPSHVFGGAGRLLLGSAKAGDTSVTHGGILVNTDVALTQTFNTPIIGLQNLQIANLSRIAGARLVLNGVLSGDGVAPRDLDFVSPLAANPALGTITLGSPLGSGLRHVNRAGDCVFVLPAGSQHTGELRIARGPVSIPAISSLGLTVDSAVEFGPRYQHSEPYRPRLTYTGPAAVSAHPIRLGGWQADGILESSGSGALTWNGSVQIAPAAGSATQVLTRSPKLTLGGDYTGADNLFAGTISDAGVLVSYDNADGSANTGPAALSVQKVGPGTWVLAGPVALSAPLAVNAGRLFVGRGTAAPFDAPGVFVASGAEFGFGADTEATLAAPVSGAGGFRKRGAGALTMTGTHTYTGATVLEAGTLTLGGALTGPGAVSTTAGSSLTGSGSIAGSLSVSGTLAPGALTVGGVLNLRATSSLRAAFTSNGASPGTVSAPVVSLSAGARVDVALQESGSTTNLVHTYWRTARSFPLVTCNSRSGTLVLGTVSPDSAGHAVSTYGAFSLQQTATGVNLLWTPLPGFPEVDTPTVDRMSPAAELVALASTNAALRLAATAGGGPTTVIAWSQVSGPGITAFADPAAADTRATFSAAGTYRLRATASNALGSVSTDLTVVVAPPVSLALRQGLNGYAHAATFVRADSTRWNSGARDQLLVGRNTATFRCLLAFDLSAIPPAATIVSATLGLWTDTAGVGSVGLLELRPLLHAFIEGTGLGSTATQGSGTGADWLTHDGSATWDTAGGVFDGTVLATVPGFAGSELGVEKTFASSPTLVAAVQAALAPPMELRLGVLSPTTEIGAANNFVRLASDDHANAGRRPLLSLTLDHPFVPAPDTGPAPAAQATVPANLGGSALRATTTQWSRVSGPGAVVFANAEASTATVTFSTAGSYVLRFTATNALGETSRDLVVDVAPPPPTPLESWRLTHFGVSANAGTAADEADPDGDGLPNLLEFACGSAPNDALSVAVPTLTIDASGTVLRCDYNRSVTAQASATVAPEWTDNLATQPVVWSTAGLTTEILSDASNLQRVRASLALPSNASRYVRLKVTTP